MSEPETAPPQEETRIHRCTFAEEIAGVFHHKPLKLVIAGGPDGFIIDLTAADAAGLALSLLTAVQALPPSLNEALRRAEVIGHA